MRLCGVFFESTERGTEMNAVKLRRVDDPTPAEIAERAAEIRRGWTLDEHLRRGGWMTPAPEMPTCNMEALTGVGGHGVSL
jgi:hypothetical protein